MFKNKIVKKGFAKLIRGEISAKYTKGTLRTYLRFANQDDFRFDVESDTSSLYNEDDGYKYRYYNYANGIGDIDGFKISESASAAHEFTEFALLAMFHLTHKNFTGRYENFIKLTQRYLFIYTYVACYDERMYSKQDLIDVYNKFKNECKALITFENKLWNKELKYVKVFIENIHKGYFDSI